MSIVWKDEYSVGIASIDEQHKKFIDILNELSQAFLSKSHQDSLKKILKELEEYSEQHFSYEEKYFQKFHYGEAVQHKEKHETFRKQVGEMKKRLDLGDDLLEYDMFLFVNDWLIVHIQQEDKKYAACFLEHGVQ